MKQPILLTVLATLLPAGCASEPVTKKQAPFDDADKVMMICCPVKNGFACDWMTEAEDGKQRMTLARISKATGVMTTVCPLSPSSPSV